MHPATRVRRFKMLNALVVVQVTLSRLPFRNAEEDRKSSYFSARTSQYNINNIFSSNFSAPDVQHSDLLSETRPFLQVLVNKSGSTSIGYL